MTQTAIPYFFMRGGTSRGPYVRRTDLPEDRGTLAKTLVAAVGSGHPLNIDGIGGGATVTTKVGMHLLQAGVSLEIIRDFLGHADVKTTQIYARANLEMKRKALEKVAGDSPLPQIPAWKQDKTLLEWLHSL
jgi:2-methylaconitate cis-trans-isomerase PrpF